MLVMLLVFFIFVLFTVLIMLLHVMTAGMESVTGKNPGVVWKVMYDQVPELQAIFKRFQKHCQIPHDTIHLHQYRQDTLNHSTFQSMRNELFQLPNEYKWTVYELVKHKNIPWCQPLNVLKHTPYCQKDKSEYRFRMGCFTRTIPQQLEDYATKQIQNLMKRLSLPNRLSRLSDSRGSTYMPPGGFMEYHSNQNHYAGWRLYMHYLPKQSVDQTAYFVYQHPFDKTYHEIEDSHFGANMFRLRKPPQTLLWHGIYSNTHRFSWGIWLPPELAQYLKLFGVRM